MRVIDIAVFFALVCQKSSTGQNLQTRGDWKREKGVAPTGDLLSQCDRGRASRD